jgi:UDP-galactopyranose mutase
VLAERIAFVLNELVVVIEHRGHIGGMATRGSDKGSQDSIRVGRLAAFRYWDMDQVIQNALLSSRARSRAPRGREPVSRPLFKAVGRSRLETIRCALRDGGASGEP